MLMKDSSFKSKVVSSTLWSFVERFSTQLVQFIITVIMARILTPSDYGLIGMIAIFISLSQIFIDGGFSSALIQRKDRSETDYCTVFFINLGISVALYIVLFFCAHPIARFYSQPLLSPILKVYAINLIINSFAAVNKTILVIRLDFKTQSKISFFSALGSGLIGIACAYGGAGVWALVIQTIIMSVLNVILSYYWMRWFPKAIFSYESFRKLFSFGSKLLVASTISSVYDNLYSLVIGKKFSSDDLGYFTRGTSFVTILSSNISSILGNVSYPILSQVQDQNEVLLNIYRKYIQLSSFIIFPLLMMLCGIAEPLIEVLLTNKWAGCIMVIRILCFAYMWNGIIIINLSLLKIKGRSDLVLKLEIIKKTIAIAILFISLLFDSLSAICIGILIYSLISLGINTYYTGVLFEYGLVKQFKEFGLYLLPSAAVLVLSWIPNIMIESPYISLLISIVFSPIAYIFVSRKMGLYGYYEARELFGRLISKNK